MSTLELSLQNKYRNTVMGLGFINNISSNTLLSGNTTIGSNLFVSNNTILENNSIIKSNLFVSTNTILNSTVTVNSYYSCNSLSMQNITINSNLNISGNMSLIGNSSILSNFTGLGNLNTDNLQVNSNVNVNSISLNQTTMISNLNILGNANIKNITPINTLFVPGITILQNSTINTSLNISSTGLLSNATINNSLNISSNSILNSVSINSQLLLSNLIINNNLSINSNLNINSNSVFNGSLSTGSLICYLNSNLKNNSTINSYLNVSGISILNSNITGLANLNVSGNTIINNDTTLLSSLYVSNNTNINNNIIINNISTINSNLTVSGNTTLVNLIVSGNTTLNLTGQSTIVMNQLPEYFCNQDAANAGIPLWGYYRTGGILKIRTDVVSPIITLTGSSNTTLYMGQTYTELGATATDNLDNIIPIIITGTVNILQIGVYVLTYTAIDSYNNQSFTTRTVNIILNLVTPLIQLNGSNIINMNINTNYTELGITSKDYLGNDLIPIITGSVNTSQLGKYLITYTVTDISGNTNSITRTIFVLNTNNQIAYQMNNPISYLYLANNYNALTTSQYWTIECWIYLTSYSSTNYSTIIDFRNFPNTISNGQFSLIISNSGMLGYWYGSSNSLNYCPGTSNVPINTWTHIAYQKNKIFMDFYINGTSVGNLPIGALFDASNISNLNQLTIGHSVDQSISTNTIHLLGSISQVKISLGNKYNLVFVSNNDLSYDLTNTLFFLNNNYKDSITNTQMTYNIAPIIWNRQYLVNLSSTNIDSTNLVFNLQVSNLSTTWVDATGNYSFIVHPNANNYSSLSKTQNGYGWKRSGNIGWTMNTSSNTIFKNINWSQGYTLEQWIYIDYDFIPSTTVSMLLVGQSSILNTNDYGFAFNQTNFPYNTNYGNVLAYTGNNQSAGICGINLNYLRGKWNHVVATNSIQTQIIPYSDVTKGCYFFNNVSVQSQIISGDFTLEGWIYPTDTLEIFNSTNLSFRYDYGYIIADFINVNFYKGTIPIALNTWTHVAYVRTGTNMKIYINGILDISIYVYSQLRLDTIEKITLGNIYVGRLGGRGNGYISQICISNYQKYLSNFTPKQDLNSTKDYRTIFFLSESYMDSVSNTVIDRLGSVILSYRNNLYNILNIYVNGGLFSTLTGSNNWGNPAASTNIFTIGCNSNNGTIQSESLNRIHFGNTRMYNRPLFQNEILNNYNLELPYYQTPTNDIYFIQNPNTISSNTITNYDLTTGWLSQTIDLNQLRIINSWTIECWAYATSWGASNDAGWIVDLSVGSYYLAFGITSSITNITPTITYDGNGRPFIYYSGDTIGQWKIKSTQIVALNQWNHIVWQKNNETTLEMFINGISTGTFTVNASDWKYPNFAPSGMNNIIIGASKSNLSSTTNHWKGKLSQIKITLGQKYTGSFTPLFDLSINDNGLFLLQDNFINNSIGKSMVNNNNVIIPTYSQPQMIILGSNPITLFAGIDTYTESGCQLLYYQRTLNITQNTIGTVNTLIPSVYSLTYTAIDSLSNLGYARRIVNVIKYNIPPVITLIGPAIFNLQVNNTYIEQGVTITTGSNQTITPVITGSVNTLIVGQYNIIYTATDSYGNTASVTRTIIVFNLPINGIQLWLDPSDTSTITTELLYGITTVKSIIDKSGNNIIINQLGNSSSTGVILTNSTINNLTMIKCVSNSMRSVNSYPNSYNITLAIIIKLTTPGNVDRREGVIWSHSLDTTTQSIPGYNWYRTQISLLNNYMWDPVQSLNRNYANVSWTTNDQNRDMIMPYTNLPMMYIGVLKNGTFKYFKMINLNTGQEYSTSGSNPLSMKLINAYFWFGGLSSYTGMPSWPCIGETMYWNRVLSNSEIYTVQNYLFNKWGNKNVTMQFTTLIPNLNLNGNSTYYLRPGSSYNELGITITNSIEDLIPTITGVYDLNTVGNYTLTYTVTDSYGTTASINRNIIITSNIPKISYDVRNCSLNNTNMNFNSLSNNNWTMECWINIYTQIMRTVEIEITIFDFRPYSAGLDIYNTTSMYMKIDTSQYTPILIITPQNAGAISIPFVFNNNSINNNTVLLNKWNHYAWMRYNNNLYAFVNGICSNPINLVSNNLLSYFNNFTQLFYIHIGEYIKPSDSTKAFLYNNGYIGDYVRIYTGIKICQPLIQLESKYNILGFKPVWDLTPSNYNNILLWLENDINVISNQSLITDYINDTKYLVPEFYLVVYRNINKSIIYNIPIEPIMTLKRNKSDNYVKINTTYTDYGVSVKYILNSTIIPYITSITDNNGTQYITNPLNALNTNIISNINTSILNTSYTITYTITDNINNITSTLNRIIYIVSNTLPSTYYTTMKPNVIASNFYSGSTNIYYYINNNIIYTSTDFVCFSNGNDVIYYMDNNKIVPSNVVTTDSNGIMWVTIGLMKMQVYNPMNYSINYNGNSYTLYININILLNSNGVYKNNNGSDFVYQYNNNWYCSTNMITFNQIIFDSTNSIILSVNSSSPIYLYNNMVLTTSPPIQIINNKTYWKFGLVCVNPTNLSDCCLYYNNTIYYQQTPTNSYAPGCIYSRYTPTYISSGSLFSSPNNTILFYIGLGFIIVTIPYSVANYIFNNGNLDSTNIYNNLQDSYSLGYSSRSGYFMMQSQFSMGYTAPFTTRNGNVRNWLPNSTGYTSSGNDPACCSLTDGIYLIKLYMQYGEYFNIIDDTYGGGFDINGISCKPTGSGTLQYVMSISGNYFDRYAIRQPAFGVNSNPRTGYLAFETKSYITLSPCAFKWDDNNQRFSNLCFDITVTNLNFNNCINPACLEPFIFDKLSTVRFDNSQIQIINNQPTAISIPATNLNTMVFMSHLATGGSYDGANGLPVPAARLFIFKLMSYNDNNASTYGINQYNSDFTYDGNITYLLQSYPYAPIWNGFSYLN